VNGAEHYAKAEELAEDAAEDPTTELVNLVAAQVHATLALAAVQAESTNLAAEHINHSGGTMPLIEGYGR
jgi:glycerol dehydrogenase-like iron-containing ADH family enzyme